MKDIDIFISHSWTCGNPCDSQRDLLVNLLNKSPYFKWRDRSVLPGDPVHAHGTDKELWSEIKLQMLQSSLVIVLAGVYASYNKWVGKEIGIAKRSFSTARPILAVEPWDSGITSQLVKSNADRIVKWDPEIMLRAIRDLA